MIYPLGVGAVSALFGAAVLWQYLSRRKAYQLVWVVALMMSALASLAYVFALPPASSALAFRLYYALGALCMPAWLGLGSIFLVAPKRATERTAAGLIAISAVGCSAVFQAGIDTSMLGQLNGGPGTGVLQPGPWLPITIVLNTLGVLAVVGVAAYSAFRGAQRRFLGANVLIAAGDLVVGVAGSMARTGHPALFWVTMFAGWCVIFAGFLMTLNYRRAIDSRPGTAPRTQPALAVPGGKTPAA